MNNEIGASQVEAGAQSREAVSLGEEIRQLRRAKGLTLRDLARGSGRSHGYLSQIERDQVRPSLGTLEGLAEALGVEVNWFFPAEAGLDDRERGIVVRSQSRRRISKGYSFDTESLGYEDFLLSGTLGLDLCMGLSRISPGGKFRPDGTAAVGHVCGYIATGRVVLEIEGETYTLFEGDSYAHDLARPHNLINVGDAPAEVIWAVSPTRVDF